MSSHWLQIDIHSGQDGALYANSTASSIEFYGNRHQLPGWTLHRLQELAVSIRKSARFREALSMAQRQTLLSLYDAVFSDGVGALHHRVAQAAGTEPVLLRFNPQETALQAFPWEALVGPRLEDGPLARQQQRRVVRWLPRFGPRPTLEVIGPLRLLLVVPDLELAALGHNMLQTLTGLSDELEVELLSGRAGEWPALHMRLFEKPAPHLLHFIGHGRAAPEPALCLGEQNPEDGLLKWLSVVQFRQALPPSLRLVYLQSCEGAHPGALVSAGAQFGERVGAAIAHLWPVSALGSQRIARRFYEVLVSGSEELRGDVGSCFAHATRLLPQAEGLSLGLHLQRWETRLFSSRQAPTTTPPAPIQAPDQTPNTPTIQTKQPVEDEQSPQLRARARHELEMLLLSLPRGTFWRWLTRTYPELVNEVIGEPAAPARRMRGVVEWLDGAGRIDTAFFNGLIEVFEGRSTDIRKVAASWFTLERPAELISNQTIPPELREALAALEAAKAQQEQLLLAGEPTEQVEAELDRLETEVGRLQFIAKAESLRPLRPSRLPFEPGLILDGRYKLVEVTGRGGFAQVWKAFDHQERQVVAVKVLRKDLTGDRGRVVRFLRGAREMAKLDHPGIVKVVGTPGETEGRPWFAMEFLHGGDLAQAFAGGRLTWETALPCLLQVGEALQHAHDHRLLHRDVKPENILLDRAGRAKLTDFDLVRVEETAEKSKTQGVAGTFLYTAPEILEGNKTTDARVDVYGLGMTALFAYQGGSLPVVLMFDRAGFFRRLSCLEALRSAFSKALAYQAEDRFESVRGLCTALQASSPNHEASIVELKAPSTRPRRTAFSLKLPLVEIPAGMFWMGSTPEEQAKVLAGLTGQEKENWLLLLERESVRHEVEISVPFMIQPTPVTQALYTRVMGYNPSQFTRNSECPVERVSWLDAVRFCNALSKVENLEPAYNIQSQTVVQLPTANGFRLPTEAEWEYACRAGTQTAYWSGNNEDDLAKAGWYSGNSEGRTHPVGKKLANPWGLFDVHGNVWEWCQDEFDNNYYSVSPSKDPPGPQSGVSPARVFRGGSFRNARRARAAYRNWNYLDEQRFNVGFRVVRKTT